MQTIEQAKKYLGVNSDGHKSLVDFYNENCIKLVKPARRYKMTMLDNWCAMFTSVVAFECGLSPDEFPYEVSVGEQVKIARSRGSFTQNVELAEEGDLIIFDWNGDRWADHVGFIEIVTPDAFGTIEGNHNKTVARRQVQKKSNAILGIIKL